MEKPSPAFTGRLGSAFPSRRPRPKLHNPKERPMTAAGRPRETVLRDIDSAIHRRERERLMPWEERAADRADNLATKAAIAAFAAINGWRKAPAFFDLSRLGRGAPTRSRHWADNCRDRWLLDHPIWFYAARRYVAAVGQPYPSPRPATR
jgi:hypothetical protein